MSIARTTGIDFSEEAETPLLNDVVRGSVDFKGRPAVRSKTGCWKSASLIICVELAERIAYYGISSNLISYLTGPLGQSTAAAAANVNVWDGMVWIMPLVGGFIADSYLGRYRTIVAATFLYILGLGFLSLSAALGSFDSAVWQNAKKCKTCPPPRLEFISFFLSLYFTAFAQGGDKPCVLTFGADQFDEENREECKAKRALFNWWNFLLVLATMLAVLLLNYIQDNLNWELAFGILCIIMCLALVVFVLGTMTYRFQIDADRRSPLTSICHNFVKATRNWLATPKAVYVQEEALESAQLQCCDKALLAPDGSKEDGKPSASSSDDDIGAAKSFLGLASIWSTCLGYAIVHSQVSTLFVKQAATMDRHISGNFQIPVASMQTCMRLSFVVFIPIYERILVPFARGITKKPAGISMLQRIGTGLFLSLLTTVVAALVEMKRLEIAHKYESGDTPLPMSVWWLAPQHVIFGVSEGFALVGLQEFFYDEVPREFGSIGLALVYCIMGVGRFLSSLLVGTVAKLTGGRGYDGWISDNLNHAHLDYFYWVLCGLSTCAFGTYLYFAKYYVYRRTSTIWQPNLG